MGQILDWIFDGVASWIASIVSSLMDSISGIFLNALGTDMSVMEQYFPFVTTAFNIIQYTAWAILFIITVWQLFRAFGGPITESENPWQLLVRSCIFAILIGFARPIFTISLDIARAPYTALLDDSMNPGDFTFAGIENILVSSLTTLVSAVPTVGLLLQIILLVALGWNYFKLLLEVVERYIVVGVLCYTSPLAYAMGGSKATNKVFQSWCRMIGSQLLLLIMNVWFLRAFNSSVGQFTTNAGALSNGQGNIFLWMFCALAFLKTAQKFDSYLSSLGLSAAQTGSSMGMELLMGMRVLSGITGGMSRSAGSIFKGGSSYAGGTLSASGGVSGISGIMAGLATKFKGNSFVGDAVVDGGAHIGAGGSIGFVGRALGGIAAKNGAELTGDSISSVAVRPSFASGSIAGEIADRSLKNYMPHLPGVAGIQSDTVGLFGGAVMSSTGNQISYSNTEISGGHISTTAKMPDGKESSVEHFSTSQYETPSSPYSVVMASDGSQWYQIASGEGMGAFYETPHFTSSGCEASQIAAVFPSAPDGTSLRTVNDGILEASNPAIGNGLWYSSAYYQEPDAPFDTIKSADGTAWYAMHPNAAVPDFSDGGSLGKAVDEYNRAQFQSFMPGYGQPVSQVNASDSLDGLIEVRHANGSGTAFYDMTMFESPRGDYKVYEDSRGGRWYAIPGTPSVSRRPVYENGKPVYDGDKMRTENVESIQYKTSLTRFEGPNKRDFYDRKAPKPKRR